MKLSKLEQERRFPTLEDFDFTRPHVNKLVDLPTAAALLIGAGFPQLSYIKRLECPYQYGIWDISTKDAGLWWETPRIGVLGDTWREWLELRYELQRRDQSAERRFYPQIISYGKAVIWCAFGFDLIPAYAVLDLKVP
jgi:hypothetical protein